METTNIKAEILEYAYDHVANTTSALVKTIEFTKWYRISGRVSRKSFLSWCEPSIARSTMEVSA